MGRFRAAQHFRCAGLYETRKKEIAKGATLPGMQPGAELQTLFLAAKVRTKSKPPNKIKKKWSPTTKKWKNKQKGNKNERKTEAKRTKVPTQTPERSKSELRTQSSEQKKRGVKTPQKIYASFCEMEPIVFGL